MKISKLISIALAMIGLFAVFVVLRTASLTSLQPNVEPAPSLSIDTNAAALRLSESVKFRTISYEDPSQVDRNAFLKLHEWLQKKYPLVHHQLQRTVLNELSLIYKWPGKNPQLNPVMFTGHMDVVPAVDENWERPPFSGVIENGFIWGRGTMDDKVTVLGVLEATEYLLENGFIPQRTIYFGFGHDEEIDGIDGALAIANHFKQQGVRFDFIMDEGMLIVKGIVPGLDPPAALVGIAEKGFANVELTVNAAGGHSSIPPPQTAVGILSNAVAKIEANPMPPRLEGVTEELFHWVAPELSFEFKLALGNLWLFGPVVKTILMAEPETNATIRTTAAPTMLSASDKANVLASRATAVINYRVLPGDSLDSLLEHIRHVIDDDRVDVKFGPGEPNAASPVSPTDSEEFLQIVQSIRAVFPQAVVAPSLGIAATDARHYQRLSDQVYRFLPILVEAEDLERMHGVNERVSVEAYGKTISFYANLMVRAAGSSK